MKKFFLLLGLAFVGALASFAQLKVNGEGNVAIKTSEQPLSPLSVGTEGAYDYGISCKGKPNGLKVTSDTIGFTEWSYAGNFINWNPNTKYRVGVVGDVCENYYGTFPSFKGYSYGVRGISGSLQGGTNYGLYGALKGMGDGAAVYGTINDERYASIALKGRYAGFFYGKVHVQTDLNVTGAVTHNAIFQLLPNQDLTLNRLNSNPTQLVAKSKGQLLNNLSKLEISTYKLPAKPIQQKNLLSSETLPQEVESYFDNQLQSKEHYQFNINQLKSLFPNLVYTAEDGSACINYSDLVPMLIVSIQALQSEVVSLRTQLNKSEGVAQTLKSEEDAQFINKKVSQPHIQVLDETLQADVFDKDGRKVCSFEVSSQTDLTTELQKQVSTGVYLVSLTSQGRVQRCEKVVIP